MSSDAKTLRQTLGKYPEAANRAPAAANAQEAAEMADALATPKAIPKLVEAVEDCTTAQLLEIATDLITENRRRSDRYLTKLLVILVAEDDPEKALEFWDEHHRSIDQREIVRSALLAQLAKKDAKLASTKIDRGALDPNDLHRGRIAVAQQLLKSDVSAGLEILEKGAHCDPCMILNGLAHGFYDSATAIRVAARDPQVAANLWREAIELETGSERSILLGGLIEKEAIEKGSAAVAAAVAKIENLEAKERNNLLIVPIMYSQTRRPELLNRRSPIYHLRRRRDRPAPI